MALPLSQSRSQTEPPSPIEPLAVRDDAGRRHGHSDAYGLGRAFVLVLLATAADVTNFLDKGNEVRYALLLIPIAAIVWIRLQEPSPYVRRFAFSDRILLLLLCFGLPGALYGTFVLGTKAGARPIFLPMIVAFLYLGTRENPTDAETRSLLSTISWVGVVYGVFSAVTHLSAFIPWGPLLKLAAYRQYKNATLLYLVMGLAATILLHRRLRALLLVALAAFIFRSYPSGTAALVFVASILTLYLMRRTRSRVRPYLVGAAIAGGIALMLLNFTGGEGIASGYFNAVGKRNNTGTRVALWEAGINQFGESPIYGNVFSGPTVVLTHRPGQHLVFQLPYHSDYILFLADGGLIGLGLLLAWVAATEVAALRRYRGYVAAGRSEQAKMMKTLLLGYNAFFVAAAFNPLFTGLSSSAAVFAIYGLMMLLGPPQPAPQDA